MFTKNLISIVLVVAMALMLLLTMNTPAIASVNAYNVMSAGGRHRMVIKDDGTLWSWGFNDSGQIGDGTTERRHTPVQIMSNVICVSHTKAIKTDGSLWSWGDNRWGGVGDGTTVNRPSPVKVMDDVISVSSSYTHTMAIKSDGSLWAWGVNISGALGTGKLSAEDNYGNITIDEDNLTPTKVMDDVAFVSTGYGCTMAIKTDGSLWAWGSNLHGAIGDGTVTEYRYPEMSARIVIQDNDRLSPIKIMDGVAFVTTNRNRTMAIKTDGSLWAWGNNVAGLLGDGTENDQHIPVKIMDNVSYVSTGFQQTMIIKTDGSLWTWGNNSYGQLGDLNTIFQHVINPIKIMDDVVSVAAGEQYTMAIKSDGSLWAWGRNNLGQLGDGTTIERYAPVKILDGVMLPGKADELDVYRNPSLIKIIMVEQAGAYYLDCPVQPFIENDYTLAPLRVIAESLEFNVQWDEQEQIITMVKADKTIVLKIGDNRAMINGKEVQLDIVPKIVENTTMVPLRFVAESFDLYVEWLQFGQGAGNIYLSYVELLKDGDCDIDDNYVYCSLPDGFPMYLLKPDGVTFRGISLGATEAEVYNAYGAPRRINNQDEYVLYTYSGKQSPGTGTTDTLIFTFSNGIVIKVELIV